MSLLDIFYEKEEKPKTPAKSQQTTTQVVTGQPMNVFIRPTDNEFIDKFRKQFAAILEDENKRNFPGNDYYEFVVMKNAMNSIPQEQIRYQAAFAGWSTGGNQTRETLLKTAHIYLGLVQKEIDDFGQAYQTEYTTQVAQAQRLLDLKKAEVIELTNKLMVANQQVANLEQQVTASGEALNAKHDAFLATGAEKKQEIEGEIQKIQQHIN